MRDNPLQFAVVREDPRVEIDLVGRYGCERALLVASGGCTALALQGRYPSLHVTLVDPNPAQLAHVRTKADRVEAYAAANAADRTAVRREFNVGHDDAAGLSESGNFESLFRGWRGVVHDLVLPAASIEEAIATPEGCAQLHTALTTHRYWPVAFQLFFGDRFLHAMFGPAATQHAEPGSYPAYFQRRFERLLADPGAHANPFLHHLLLGRYLDRPDAWPEFLQRPAAAHRFTYCTGDACDLLPFAEYDCIALSNVCDWMAPERVQALLARLRTECRPGTVVVWRQLNNLRDLAAPLEPAFVFDRAWEDRRRETERSGFYNRLRAGVRR